MEELRYRENDRFFPIPENEKDIQAIRALTVTGTNVLKRNRAL